MVICQQLNRKSLKLFHAACLRSEGLLKCLMFTQQGLNTRQ
jgi:hypothetical protein